MGEQYDNEQLSKFVDALFERLERVEKQVLALSQGSGVPVEGASAASAVPQDVVELARSGDRIAAVKRYREATGVSLDEARQAVEQL